jgi:hypothetical protein
MFNKVASAGAECAKSNTVPSPASGASNKASSLDGGESNNAALGRVPIGGSFNRGRRAFVLLIELNTSNQGYHAFLAFLSSSFHFPFLLPSHCLGTPLYNAHTRPDWPVRGGVLVYETRDPVSRVVG